MTKEEYLELQAMVLAVGQQDVFLGRVLMSIVLQLGTLSHLESPPPAPVANMPASWLPETSAP